MKHLIFSGLMIILISSGCQKEKNAPNPSVIDPNPSIIDSIPTVIDSIPSAFKSFTGTYIVNDTFIERIVIWDTVKKFHLEDLQPVPKSDKIIALEVIPGESPEIYNAGQDTALRMLLRIDTSTAYKVSVHPNGTMDWFESRYFYYKEVKGSIIGDSIRVSVIESQLYPGNFFGDLYRGRR